MDTLLASGYLTKTSTDGSSEKHPFRMEFLQDKHIPDIMALQQLIAGRLSRPDMLESFSLEFMKMHVQTKGRIIGVLVEDQLIAFRNLFFPDPDDREWNLGIDLNLPPDELKFVANLQMVCVHPLYRGNHLALNMNGKALQYLHALHTIRHVCATVSPYNFWNVQVLLNSGFAIQKIKEKYGGKLRFIMYRNPAAGFCHPSHERISVPLLNIQRQNELLQEGFAGVQLNNPHPFQATRPSSAPVPVEGICNDCEVVYARL